MKKKTLISVSLAAGLLLGVSVAPAVARIEKQHGLTAAAESAVTSTGWKYTYYDDHCEITGCTSDLQGDVMVPKQLSVKGNKLPVTKITGSFYFCGDDRNYITSITVPESIKVIEASVFWGMSNLKSATFKGGLLVLPNSLFSDCKNLEKVELAEGTIEIGARAFSGCSKLSEITIPSTVTTVGTGAFRDCAVLKQITVPAGVSDIPENCFRGCAALETVEILDGVQNVGEYAFAGCSSLKELTFPKSVLKVNSRLMFSDCTALKKMTFENPDCAINFVSGTEENKLTICGYENSTAQAYCDRYSEGKYLIFRKLNPEGSTEPVVDPPVDTGFFCDANGDGDVDVTDAQMVLTYYVQKMANKNPSWYEITQNPKAPDAP